jgi:eukaryotic-like serine/threonine-protein kinase
MSEVGGEHQPDPDGRLIDGRYLLLEQIGAGGSGTVWRAFDQTGGLEVAVKQPRLVGESGEPEGEERQRAVNRLCHEARVAARLDHPSAIAVHDVVVEDALPWVVMEYVRGESLGVRLRRGTVEHREAARIGLAVLGALRAAHAAGMVHRDLKPANVLLGEDGRVLLTDFGIAHGSGDDSGSGDAEFAAPEQLSEYGAGPASDLWSLGALLYAAVEGEAPPRDAAVTGTVPADASSGGPLGALLVRMLAREPGERPGAAEVAVVLEAVAEGRDVPEVPVPATASSGDRASDRASYRAVAGVSETDTATATDTAADTPPVAASAEGPARTDGPEEEPAESAGDAVPDTGDASGPHPRNSPLRRLLSGLGLALPPVSDSAESPDQRTSARAIR